MAFLFLADIAASCILYMNKIVICVGIDIAIVWLFPLGSQYESHGAWCMYKTEYKILVSYPFEYLRIVK